MKSRSISITFALVAAITIPVATAAHSPSVVDADNSTPSEAVVLLDPTLSRAIGASIDQPGEIDWYRMDLRAGEPLVVGMTAPDTNGAVAATFTLVGPGLPDPGLSGLGAEVLADIVAGDGAIAFEPAADPSREIHGGLGFINYGNLSLVAPADGSYWVAVSAVDPAQTGKYVFAPGQREEFGIDAIEGMADLVGFFNAPWPAEG